MFSSFLLSPACHDVFEESEVCTILQLLNDNLATVDLAKIIRMQRLTTHTEYFTIRNLKLSVDHHDIVSSPTLSGAHFRFGHFVM